jgi:hypothetical protein
MSATSNLGSFMHHPLSRIRCQPPLSQVVAKADEDIFCQG